MRVLFACALVVACESATWADTFAGQDTRSNALDEAGPVDDEATVVTSEGGAPGPSCATLAASRGTVPITVTFPNHGGPSETIHVVAASGSCDITVDSDTDDVMFSSDAIPCAKLLAPGTPSQGSVTVSGSSSPADMTFTWSYGLICTVTDDYSLTKQ